MIGDVVADFYEHTTSPKQDVIDFLTKRHGVPNLALAFDSDGLLNVVGSAFVVANGSSYFDFACKTDDGASKALVIVARDISGEPLDLVAWQGRQNVTRVHLGRASVLGEHQILAPRLGDPLAVRPSVLDWLRAGRTGVVILDAGRAWRTLEGETLAAVDVEHGLSLRRALQPPAPRIVVPKSQPMRKAA